MTAFFAIRQPEIDQCTFVGSGHRFDFVHILSLCFAFCFQTCELSAKKSAFGPKRTYQVALHMSSWGESGHSKLPITDFIGPTTSRGSFSRLAKEVPRGPIKRYFRCTARGGRNAHPFLSRRVRLRGSSPKHAPRAWVVLLTRLRRDAILAVLAQKPGMPGPISQCGLFRG